jgi:hypothetical protein
MLTFLPSVLFVSEERKLICYVELDNKALLEKLPKDKPCTHYVLNGVFYRDADREARSLGNGPDEPARTHEPSASSSKRKFYLGSLGMLFYLELVEKARLKFPGAKFLLAVGESNLGLAYNPVEDLFPFIETEEARADTAKQIRVKAQAMGFDGVDLTLILPQGQLIFCKFGLRNGLTSFMGT